MPKGMFSGGGVDYRTAQALKDLERSEGNANPAPVAPGTDYSNAIGGPSPSADLMERVRQQEKARAEESLKRLLEMRRRRMLDKRGMLDGMMPAGLTEGPGMIPDPNDDGYNRVPGQGGPLPGAMNDTMPPSTWHLNIPPQPWRETGDEKMMRDMKWTPEPMPSISPDDWMSPTKYRM